MADSGPLSHLIHNLIWDSRAISTSSGYAHFVGYASYAHFVGYASYGCGAK